jgi:uncharacterized protein
MPNPPPRRNDRTSRRPEPVSASGSASAKRRRDIQPLTDRELDELQNLLDRVPPPLDPLDVCMLDGFLCGVLLQPRRVPEARWLPHLTDAEGRSLPGSFDTTRLRVLALRRHAELDDAIERRQWFDPWVFELSDDDSSTEFHGRDDHVDPEGERDDAQRDESAPPEAIDAVYPWVAGFSTAMEFFPELMALDVDTLTEPLALVYRHLSPDDLEDADDLLAEIESLEPPADLAESVEGLVRATLLLADVSRPVLAPATGPRPNAGVAKSTGHRPRSSRSSNR